MTRGMTGQEPDPREVYADIIGHPHHVSPTRPRMSLEDRAAQFAPFAALTGYGDMIDEEARLTGERIEPGEEQLAELNRILSVLSRAVARGNRPEAAVTYFVPDPLKAGGTYETVTGKIRRVEPIRGVIRLEADPAAGSCLEIRMKDILEIRAEEEE